ncbi:hypothetical protein C8F04DRAFT_1073328 [Mycena alexandri]|uniref:Uncharacterized protein n=1 Tax=Mycena alexandri TaxID=1745969 RepID=A0AAD6TDR0_9AGAR|nr:hypothetical protein C8F04DRAFT_1073328 [Mycena alexandri]
MPGIPDGSLSILASPLSPTTAAKVMLSIFGLLLIVTSLHYISPARLTRVLSDAMSTLEKVYADLVCTQLMGLLTADDVARLRILQLEVGALRTETLIHSLSWRTTICAFLKGRSYTLYHCINEVKKMETRIKILEGEHRRRFSSGPLATGVSHPTGTARFRNLTA